MPTLFIHGLSVAAVPGAREDRCPAPPATCESPGVMDCGLAAARRLICRDGCAGLAVSSAEVRRYRQTMRIPRWFGSAAPDEARLRLPGADGWAAFLEARLSELQMQRLDALELQTDRGARPWQDPDWREEVDRHRHDLRTLAALQQMVAALRDAVPITPPSSIGAQLTDARPLLVCEVNTVTAVNALWAAARFSTDPDRTADTTGAILHRVLTEPWSVDSPLLRNACISILGELATPRAIDELMSAARLAPAKRVKAQILLALDRIASADAPEADRIAELRVPRHGLDKDAKVSLATRDRAATLELLPSGDVRVVEVVDAGTPGDEHARHAVEKRVRDIESTYARELNRVEDLLSTQRTWPLADWSKLYLEHPITRAVACRLVWRLYPAEGSACEIIPALGGGLLAVDGHSATVTNAISATAVTPAMPGGPEAMVELWHPGTASAASLASWRRYLPNLPSGQPFPQIARWHTRRPPDHDGLFVTDYSGWETDYAAFTATARARRWQWRPAPSNARPRPDADDVPGGLCLREYAEAQLTCALEVTLDGETVRCGRARFHRRRDRQRQPVPLGVVPYRVYSEAVRCLALLAGAELAEDEIQDLPPVADALADRGSGVTESDRGNA